jgi:ElaB/YqjD/DUF883 family membrane-anchored ribosome-binding protein
MDQKPEVIRHRIEETRSALTEKLETLEREVFGTVRDAKEAVTTTVDNVREAVNCTVANVRDTVNDTVGTVREQMHATVTTLKETLDPRYQTRAHPWVMFGGSVAAGFALGRFLPSSTSIRERLARIPAPAAPVSPFATHAEEPAPPYARAEPMGTSVPRTMSEGVQKAKGFFSDLLAQFGPELEKVKSLAIGTAVALGRDMLKERIPEQLVHDFEDLCNNITVKLGGEPVHGTISPSDFTEPHERYVHEEESMMRREDPGSRRFNM